MWNQCAGRHILAQETGDWIAQGHKAYLVDGGFAEPQPPFVLGCESSLDLLAGRFGDPSNHDIAAGVTLPGRRVPDGNTLTAGSPLLLFNF